LVDLRFRVAAEEEDVDADVDPEEPPETVLTGPAGVVLVVAESVTENADGPTTIAGVVGTLDGPNES
jgi:hypothetical protein